MLDIKYIRENAELIGKGAVDKRIKFDIDAKATKITKFHVIIQKEKPNGACHSALLIEPQGCH